MPLVTALDFSRKSTGVAHDAPDGRRPILSTVRLPVVEGGPSEGYDYGPCAGEYIRWLDAHIKVVKPDIIAYEAPLPARPKGGDIYIPETTVRTLMGLPFLTEGFCHLHGIQCEERNLSTVKKHFAGYGRAEKHHMVARCRQLKWDCHNEDEADAAGLWSLIKAEHDPKFVLPPPGQLFAGAL